ncbi:MAG: hypothetical protein WBG46_10315 [Nonlabens sp.]
MAVLQYILLGSLLGLIISYLLESLERSENIDRRNLKRSEEQILIDQIKSLLLYLDEQKSPKKSDIGKRIVLEFCLENETSSLTDLESLNRTLQSNFAKIYNSQVSFKLNYPEALNIWFTRSQLMNIGLFLNESINNSTKHAESSFCLNLFTYQDDIAQIITHDDGTGFDMERPQNHAGIDAMDAYAQNLSSQLIVSSIKGIGTKITIPLYKGKGFSV